MRVKKRLRVYAALLGLASLLALAVVQNGATAQRRAARTQPDDPAVYSVRAYGARGDGKTVDTPAVNRAIEAAAAAGGGTVHFPAGTYLCFSMRLKSNVALRLEHGAVILAADPERDKGTYDTPEPNEWDMY